MISSRVAEDSERLQTADFEGDYIIAQVPTGKWRIYDDATGYSQTSGQVIKLGKVVRRMDADADYDGRIAQFKTKDEAVEYVRKYLTRRRK